MGPVPQDFVQGTEWTLRHQPIHGIAHCALGIGWAETTAAHQKLGRCANDLISMPAEISFSLIAWAMLIAPGLSP